MIKEALIDYSSGKAVRLSLDGKEVDGVIRIDKITNLRSNNKAKEIQITILANDLKIITCNGEVEKIHEF
jgi:hypothetical protein